MPFRKSEHTARKVAIGSAIAGAAGYLAGILTAPKSGKATREELIDSAEGAKDSVEDQLRQTDAELKDVIANAKLKGSKVSAAAKADFSQAMAKAKDAQAKSAGVLKAVKAGQTDDPDLNKAVKQAKLAIKNLAKYYKN